MYSTYLRRSVSVSACPAEGLLSGCVTVCTVQANERLQGACSMPGFSDSDARVSYLCNLPLVFNLSFDDLAWLPYHIATIFSLLARQLELRADQILFQVPHRDITVQLSQNEQPGLLTPGTILTPVLASKPSLPITTT